MRVTFVLPYAGLSGGTRVLASYAERLRRRNHQVFVVSIPELTHLRRKIKSFLLGRGWPADDRQPGHFDGLDVEHHVLESDRPVTDADVPDADVVVATYYPTAYGVQKLSAAKGAKAIFIQGYEVEPGKINRRLDGAWRLPMHKIVISNWLTELAREKFGDSAVSLVPNSVDLEQFHAVPRGKSQVPTVGLLYHSNPLKGCAVSLRALAILARALPRLHVIAFGAEEPSFRLKLPPYVEFHYRPPQDRLRDLYAQCDVWLCGSNREGFHLPPLEAMACRCPVVSTRVGGPLDTIEEGINGHLVDVKDAHGLSERLLRVLKLPEEDWKKMSEAAYRTAKRFSWEDATDLLEKALELAVLRTKRGDFGPVSRERATARP